MTETSTYSLPMQRDVAIVHRAMGHPDRMATPGFLPLDRVELRVKLIRGEGIIELLDEAITPKSFKFAIDSLIDTLYVTYGTFVEMGIDARNELKDTAAAKLRGGYALPNRLGKHAPSVTDIARLAELFGDEIQLDVAHVMLVNGWVIPSEPVFNLAALKEHLANNTRNLAALTGWLNEGAEGMSLSYLGKIIFDQLSTLTLLGIDAAPFYAEAQRANLSKLDDDGNAIISRGEELDGEPEGKFIKGPNYKKPDFAGVYQQVYGETISS